MTATALPTPDPADQAALYAALAAVQASVPTVAKTKTANVPTKSGGSYSYTYADLADVTEEALPLLAKNGLAFVCLPARTDRGYELAGVLTHESGGHLSGALPLHGNTPQELGSSITYGRRYLLGCLTGLVTDNDDDGRTGNTRTRTREWDGPNTATLLSRIDAAAAQAGVTYEQATARFCRDKGITVNDLDGMEPWLIAPLTDAVEKRAAEVVAEQQKATEATPEVSGDTTTPEAAAAAGEPRGW